MPQVSGVSSWPDEVRPAASQTEVQPMNSKAKPTVVFLALVAAATGALLAQQPPIKVGVINVLSGSFAAFGRMGK